MKYCKWEQKNLLYFREIKNKLQGAEDTRNYSIIYSGVKQNI